MLSKLPIEIMDQVFGYLDQRNKLNLAKVSQHLGSAFAYHARDKYKKLYCSKYTDDELKVIVPLCGSTVVELDIGFRYDKKANSKGEIFKLIAKHCVHLESASFDITKSNIYFCKYVLSMKGLNNIMLSFFYGAYTKSDLLHCISPDCEVLAVEWSSVYKCDLKPIFETASNLKKLRVLRLCDIPQSFQEQELELTELEELELDGCEIEGAFPKCPKLRLLKLKNRFYDYFDTIAKYSVTLEHLSIISYYDRQYGNLFIRVLRECTKLKSLVTSIGGLVVLLNEYLQSFIDFLKERGFNKERRFVMNGVKTPESVSDLEEFDELTSKTADSEVWNLITLD